MTDKTAPYEVVPALAEHIARRMEELKLDPNGLAAATGLSLTVLGQVRKGYRKSYQRRLTWPLCAALGWTPDSIERILAGDEPLPATPPSGGGTNAELDALRADVDRLEELIQQLQAEQAARLEREARRSRHSAKNPG